MAQLTGYPPITTCIVTFDTWSEGSEPSCNVAIDGEQMARVVERGGVFYLDYDDIQPLELIPFGYNRNHACYQVRVRLESGTWKIDRYGMLVKSGEVGLVERLLRRHLARPG